MNSEHQLSLAHVGYYPTVTLDVSALILRQLDVLHGTSRLSEFRTIKLPVCNFWNNLFSSNRSTQTDSFVSKALQTYKKVAILHTYTYAVVLIFRSCRRSKPRMWPVVRLNGLHYKSLPAERSSQTNLQVNEPLQDGTRRLNVGVDLPHAHLVPMNVRLHPRGSHGQALFVPLINRATGWRLPALHRRQDGRHIKLMTTSGRRPLRFL